VQKLQITVYGTMCEGVSKSFWTESIMKYTTINIHWEVTQRVMAAKLTRLTLKIVIKLHLVTENCTIFSSHSRQPIQKLWIHPHRWNRIFVCMHTHQRVKHNMYYFYVSFVMWNNNL